MILSFWTKLKVLNISIIQAISFFGKMKEVFYLTHSDHKNVYKLDAFTQNNFIQEFNPIIQKHILDNNSFDNAATFLSDISKMSNLQPLLNKDSWIIEPEDIHLREPLVISFTISNNYKVYNIIIIRWQFTRKT